MKKQLTPKAPPAHRVLVAREDLEGVGGVYEC